MSYALFAYLFATGHGDKVAAVYGIYIAIHILVNIGLVASVVGIREAVLGFLPWLIVNWYTRWLYLAALFREWILGRHYASWTGRQGRATVITPMTSRRKLALTALTAVAAVFATAAWLA